MQRIILRRDFCKTQIRRGYSQALKFTATNTTVETLEYRLKSLISNYDQFVRLTGDLYDYAGHADFVDPCVDLDELEEKHFKTHALIVNVIHMVKNSIQDSSVNENPESIARRCDVPQFTGNQADWSKFRNLFISFIARNSDLSNSQKLIYLKRCVADEAYGLIKNFKHYRPAWEKLEQNYQKKPQIINLLINNFLMLPDANGVQIESLRKLASAADEAICGLNALSCDQRDPWLIQILLAKVDCETSAAWTQRPEANLDNTSIEDFLKFLFLRCNSLEIDRIELSHDFAAPNNEKTKVKRYNLRHSSAIEFKCKRFKVYKIKLLKNQEYLPLMDTKSNDDSAGSDSLDKSMQQKCVMVETSTASMMLPDKTIVAVDVESDDCSRDSTALQASVQNIMEASAGKRQQQPLQSEQKTDMSDAASIVGESLAATEIASSNINSSSGGDMVTASSTAFETKVTQISQNLKETTLAETTTTTATETVEPISNDIIDGVGDSSNSPVEEPTDLNNSTDETDRRVKKVHFHPDVKENDGGNRVKKKHRIAGAQNNKSSDAAKAALDGMDMDEDYVDEEVDEDYVDEEVDDEEAEEEFDLAKTIAEADDYLKQHPLTFVRRIEQNGEQVRDGLLNVEDAPSVLKDDADESDEDFYKKYQPENGIDRVLGKETKAGKVEFLLRYENQGSLFWESEEYIKRMCPTLLIAYEKNRERRQQRLMHHVAQRQSMRQRYTDF